MRRTLAVKLVTVASVCVLAALSAHANLVINGGFETGAFSPWTAGGVPGPPTITAVPADVHSGTYAAELNPFFGAISQSVPIVGGTTYSLDFWVKADGVGTLTVTLDSVTVDSLLFVGATAYTHHTYASVTPLATGTLNFAWSDGGTQHAFLDDVNLAAVPEPTTMIAGAMLLLPFGASTLRFMRKARVA
jgi:hypothetical protein